MERIQNILQRLQELYYGKHQKSAIDIDLMLDYTRVMYADLLELKRNTPHASANLPPEEKGAGNQEEVPPAMINEAAGSKEAEPVQAQAMTENKATEETPEPEVKELVLEEERGISFEPPHPGHHAEVLDEVLVEEDPVVNEPVENIEIPVPAISADFPAATPRDIRSGIGINDKYLFLNELFNNHKTEYEETLDHLNRFTGYEEAANWLNKNAAVNNRWAEDDETVQGFFSVLKKHFSASR